MKWCRLAQIRPNATSFHMNPGKPNMPMLNAALNLEKEISDEIELSNIQMMNGIRKNMIAPLTRCIPEAREAKGQRSVRKLENSMFLNSGRGLLGLVADSDIRCFLGLISGLHNNEVSGSAQVIGNSIATQQVPRCQSICIFIAWGQCLLF